MHARLFRVETLDKSVQDCIVGFGNALSLGNELCILSSRDRGGGGVGGALDPPPPPHCFDVKKIFYFILFYFTLLN